jgi:PST family polysaccharide transporter
VVLPAQQAGLVNWGTALCALLFYVLDAGIETAVVIAAKRKAVQLRTMATVVGGFRAAAAVVALSAWAIGILAGRLGSAESVVLLLVGGSNMIRLFQTPFSAALQVRDRQAEAATINVIPAVVRVLGLSAVILLNIVSVPSVLLVAVAGDALGLLTMAWAAYGGSRLQPDGAPMSWRLLVRELLGAAPMITAGQAVIMAQSRVDWLLVAALASYAALANYALANKAIELIVLGGSIFGRAALPWFVEGWASRDIGPTVRNLIGITSAGGLLLAVAGWPFLHLVTGQKYAGAAPMIPVLAALGPALVLFQIVQFAAVGQGAARHVVVAGGAALIAQVGIDLFAIPRLGAIGAVYGMCAFAAISLPMLLGLAWSSRIMRARAALELLVGAALLPALLAVVEAIRFV